MNSSLELVDRDLAEAMIAGREGAFQEFAERHGAAILAFARRICGTHAEEVMQETFLRAYRSVKDLRDPSALKSWIYRISVNECRKIHNRDRRGKELEIPLDEVLPGADADASDGRLADWSEVPLDRLLQGELKEKLDEAIQNLPDDFRIVLVLRDMEGFSTAQTAEILEIGEPLVKVRLHRARLAIRRGLAEYLSCRSTSP